MAPKIRVTIWNEYLHEREEEKVKRIYPKGIHGAIAERLGRCSDLEIRTATLDQPEHGLAGDVLDTTDVLFWWGHKAHDKVSDAVVARVRDKVLEGMGLCVLHSAHFSKIFRSLMGTNCSLKWREMGERERLWNVAPAHPLTQGLPEQFELKHHEMYGERFDIPEPNQLIFMSWYEGGNVFRSGCVFNRGHGKIFYFSPGHETYPVYHQAEVQQVLENAARWLAPVRRVDTTRCVQDSEPLEPLFDTIA